MQESWCTQVIKRFCIKVCVHEVLQITNATLEHIFKGLRRRSLYSFRPPSHPFCVGYAIDIQSIFNFILLYISLCFIHFTMICPLIWLTIVLQYLNRNIQYDPFSRHWNFSPCSNVPVCGMIQIDTSWNTIWDSFRENPPSFYFMMA